MRYLGLLFALLFFCNLPEEAQAQQRVLPCTYVNVNTCLPVSNSNPFPVSASVSASITGFRPVSAGTPISVTTGGVTGTLPTNTGEVVATNVGTTNGAYCALGASATTSAQYIAPNGGWFAFAISGDTQLTCITSTSTTTVNMVGGSGLPTGTGGGGGGSGSSGAVFGPTAVGSAAANPPVLTGGTADGSATGNVGVWKIVSGVGSANTAQVNGVTTLTGTGAVGTGAQRVAVGTDTATIAGSAPGTAGTPSTNVVSVQGVASGTVLPANLTQLLSAAPSATNPLWIAEAQPTPTTMQNGATGNGNGTILAVTGYGAALVNVNCSVSCSGGTTINFEGTDSVGTFFSVAAYPIAGGASVTTATTSGQFLIPATGLVSLRARISAYSAGTITVTGSPQAGTFPAVAAGASGGTSITDNAAFTTGTTSETPIGCYAGTPSATANHSTIVACTTAGSVHTTVDNANANGQALAANSSPVVAPVATVAGAAVVKGGVPVVNGGSFYEAVAASQTATVLQSSTGAAGDYLSHCVIYPASTSPGAVTVFDNTNSAANSAILFAGGASSLSNLAPIPIPVGAVSVNGAWKVTTGANVSVVCSGKFS